MFLFYTKEMNEEGEKTGALDRIRVSRRDLFRLGLAIGVGAIARRDTIRESGGHEIPEDILSKEELAQNRIDIIGSPQTQLLVRPGIFEFPIFKDAKEGKHGGVVIGLLDSPNLDWRKSKHLTGAAREVFDLLAGPVTGRKKVDQDTDMYRFMLEMTNRELNEINKDSRQAKSLLENAEGLKKVIGLREGAIKGSDDEFMEYFMNFYPWGPRGYKGVLLHPIHIQNMSGSAAVPEELKNKYYIFLGIEGIEPDPQNSYPDPTFLDQLRVKEDSPQSLVGVGKYRFDSSTDFNKKLPSFILRHELSHYATPIEDQADAIAYEGLMGAWTRLQSGDTTGYPFIFKNANGLTVA